MTEAVLTRKIKKACEGEGAYAAKIHGGQFSAGVPDLLLCYHGRFVAMEIKMPGREHTVTKLQAEQLKKIRRAGGVGEVVSSVDQALKILRKVDREYGD